MKKKGTHFGACNCFFVRANCEWPKKGWNTFQSMQLSPYSCHEEGANSMLWNASCPFFHHLQIPVVHAGPGRLVDVTSGSCNPGWSWEHDRVSRWFLSAASLCWSPGTHDNWLHTGLPSGLPYAGLYIPSFHSYDVPFPTLLLVTVFLHLAIRNLGIS